jgi:hypothetical protein
MSPRRRLWVITVLGLGTGVALASSPQPIVGLLLESGAFFLCGFLALFGLLGHGPLRVKAELVVSDVDELVRLAGLCQAGVITRQEFEAAKRRIIEA